MHIYFEKSNIPFENIKENISKIKEGKEKHETGEYFFFQFFVDVSSFHIIYTIVNIFVSQRKFNQLI